MNLKKFGDGVKSATGVSLAALIIIVASNGSELLKVLGGLPVLINAYATSLPLGLWSGVIGTALAGGFHSFARSWHKKSLGIEVASILVGVAAVTAQMWGSSAGDMLKATMIGVIAGLTGLYSSKLLRSMFRREKNEDAPTDAC